MRLLYKLIVCAVICICSSATLEAQTLIDYQQQKKKEVAERQRVEKQRYESACQKELLKHFKSISSYIPKGNMQLMLETG